MRSSSASFFAKIVLSTLFAILAISSAFANVSGAIFTTDSTGTKVNGNLYPAKTAVYLNGGPQNQKDPGLVPDGNYYFQVTDPSGKVLLSADDVSCREVSVVGGRIVGLVSAGCTTDLHLLGTFNSSNGEQPVQLCPAVSSPPRPDTLSDGHFDPNNWCDTTPNPGGEYKAWLTPVADYGTGDCTDPSHISFGFCDADSKTDNFKVQFTPPPPPCPDPNNPICQNPPPPSATLVACKYWDKDDDGFNEGPDVLLSGWVITATADAANTVPLTLTNGSSTGSSASGTTDITGCTTFAVTGFTDGTTPESVTLNETLQPNWNQVAPLQGTYAGGTGGSITVTGCNFSTAPIPACTSTSDVPLIGDGSTTVAPDFGNTGLDLTVTKTATPGFTRTYNWTIAKSVDKTLIETTGSTATFNYTVVASQTGFTDSGWQVTGSITVANPNTFDVAGVTVTENGDGVGTCTLDVNGLASLTGVTVPAGGSKSYTYTCTYGSNPTSGTNQATATWTAATYNTPDGSASNTAAYTFGAPTNPVNKTITVTDTYWTNLPTPTTVTLGTCTATDTTPYASCTFNYSRVITVKAGCFFYDNTATIKETGLTSKVEVEVCGPAATGALTMGFWQNKNGQGIITGGAYTLVSGVKVCNSGTWLRQYAPFQDLSSTATCAQVATYVYNVIKAATCGGSTCNAMLKPQMLSTALDVYFSDPTLGGNKIGAPAAIGPVKIDLAHVCNMIDGSGGTATCSGTFLDCSSAFGGATCMSVSQILAYAGSQSNVGGSFWYGQAKATQVLAKNVFDAINNRVAFNCP